MNDGLIILEDLKVSCIIGIYPHEREAVQDLFLTVKFKMSFQKASETEQVSNTVDYDLIAKSLTIWIQNSEFQLIETIAQKGCQKILTEFTLIQSCSILVKKPQAVHQAKYAGVFFEQTR